MSNNAEILFDVEIRYEKFYAEYERARKLFVSQDSRLGLIELEELARSGSIMSILLLGDAMRYGWICDQDLEGAEAWYRVAVKAGFPRGLFGLALTHLLMNRFNAAIEELNAAISKNNPPAYNSLAGIYFRGDGVPIDRQRALQLWRKGASLGHLPSKRNLIRQFIRGKYGFWNRVVGLFEAFPFAFEIVNVERTAPDSDRLR